MLTMTLAKRIRDFRYAKGWGPDELAGRAQISRTALYQIECGKTETPRASTLSRIARALGVSVECLLGFDTPSLADSSSHDRPARLAAEHDVVKDVFGVTDPPMSLSGRQGGPVAGPRLHDVERKFHDLLETPLGESLARIVEESYRLLPVRTTSALG
jgi:transcriptional regulator with XRE-family HTH domain